ncbi:MAG: hypothetical protein ACI35O_17610 [Bacillaceae bacterium]
MYCVIASGRYETGSTDHQQNYQFFFGEEQTKEKYDLYFHWYNIIHEVGHLLVELSGLVIHPADEEQLVNEFAVAYWQEVDKQGYLEKVEALVNDVLSRISRPIPEDVHFLDYFRENWGTLDMPIEMYGFFQMACVANAFSSNKNLPTILEELNYKNVTLPAPVHHYYEISTDCAHDVLNDCISYFKEMEIELLPIKLQLVDNPDMHCCQIKE